MRKFLRNSTARRASIALLMALFLGSGFQWVNTAMAAGHFTFTVVRNDKQGYEVKVDNPGCPDGWEYKTSGLSHTWEDGEHGHSAKAWCERQVPDPNNPGKTIRQKCWESSKWIDRKGDEAPTRNPNETQRPTRTPSADCPLCTATPEDTATPVENTATPVQDTATPVQDTATPVTSTPPGGGDTKPTPTAQLTATPTKTRTPHDTPHNTPVSTTVTTQYLAANLFSECRVNVGYGANINFYTSPDMARAYGLGNVVQVYSQANDGNDTINLQRTADTNDGSYHWIGVLDKSSKENHYISIKLDKTYDTNVTPFCTSESTSTTTTTSRRQPTPVRPNQPGKIPTPNAGFAPDMEMIVYVPDPVHAYDNMWLALALVTFVMAIALLVLDRKYTRQQRLAKAVI